MRRVRINRLGQLHRLGGPAVSQVLAMRLAAYVSA